MDIIDSPKFKNTMVRGGELILTDVISELGIYGTWISDGPVVHLNEMAGHLLRTKRYPTFDLVQTLMKVVWLLDLPYLIVHF